LTEQLGIHDRRGADDRAVGARLEDAADVVEAADAAARGDAQRRPMPPQLAHERERVLDVTGVLSQLDDGDFRCAARHEIVRETHHVGLASLGIAGQNAPSLDAQCGEDSGCDHVGSAPPSLRKPPSAIILTN
jgi:hypothetical protein